MAVHVPLSIEAQAEARFDVAANNILKPQDGRPVVSPAGYGIGLLLPNSHREDAKAQARYSLH